jgi:hypothetical protein
MKESFAKLAWCRTRSITLLMLLSINSSAGNKTYFDGSDNLYSQAPANEVAALPKYCWGKYIAKFKGPQFKISPQCGAGTNHFCQGLLRFNRSQHPMALGKEKATYLHGAIKNFEYTWRYIKDLPGCPIRRDVQLIYRRATALRAGAAAMDVQR